MTRQRKTAAVRRAYQTERSIWRNAAWLIIIGLNNSYLQDTLNACPADSLKVQYDGALSPVLFRSKSEQAEIVQVIVPMRLSAE